MARMQESALIAGMLSLAIGVIAGLRTMTAPAAVSWAAASRWLDLDSTWLAFLGYTFTPWILTLFALGELVIDKLASTPSRTVAVQFGARIVSGALAGAAIGASGGRLAIGVVAGIAGAFIGTVGGRAFRARLASALRSDRPAALIEDAIAVGGALLLMVTRA